MKLENGHLVFDILDPSVNACGMDRVYYSAKPTDTVDKVVRILSAGSKFFWHLKPKHNHPIANALKVEFMELDPDTGYCTVSLLKGNLLQNDAIEVYVDSVPKLCGIKITNNSNWDLFPAVFYFDHSDWSIRESVDNYLNLPQRSLSIRRTLSPWSSWQI